jgi:hypothetical protein
MTDVEVKNDTEWPWKRGCVLGLFDLEAFTPLVFKDIPIDFEVRGMETFKLSIPV